LALAVSAITVWMALFQRGYSDNIISPPPIKAQVSAVFAELPKERPGQS
jgi:hypothetical protein